MGDLLAADLFEKQARSINYQISIAKLAFSNDIKELIFDDS